MGTEERFEEGVHIEFKESWSDDCLKGLSAFANTDSGTMYIGVNDKSVVKGLSDDEVKKLLKAIPDTIGNALGITADVRRAKMSGKNIVTIYIERQRHPVFYHAEAYIRCGSTSRKMNGSELGSFLQKKIGKSWTDYPADDITIGMLDNYAFDWFKERGHKLRRFSDEEMNYPIKDILGNLGLLDGDVPTRAAAIMFHKNPRLISKSAYIRIGRFDDSEDSLTIDELEGPMYTLVDRTMDLITTKYTITPMRIEGLERKEYYPYPYDAVREGLVNAIANQDYSTSNPIRITLFDDRLEIWNAGCLPFGYTLEGIMNGHISIPRNEGIANVFFKAHYVEKFGRGMEMMKNAYEYEGVKPPEYFEESGSFIIKFFDILHAKGIARTGAVGEKFILKRGEERPVLSDIQKKAIRLINENGEMGRKELTNALDVSDTLFRRNVADPLLDIGYVELKYPFVPRHMHQKYRVGKKAFDHGLLDC